jgi:uncharacterized protein (DUF488 family)
MKKIIYTIGHSDLDSDTFLKLLKQHHVEALIDIRSQPYSSYVKHFNKEIIKNLLAKEKIDYYYGGNYLGGKPGNEAYYKDAKLDIAKYRKSDEYKKGFQMLIKLASLKTIVLMCAEEDPNKCHRHLIITADMLDKGYEVRHIRSDGSYEIAIRKSIQLDLPELLDHDTDSPKAIPINQTEIDPKDRKFTGQ